MRTIDLHAHTTASDGSLTPTQLMQLAVDAGLSAVAVTDHDTVDGLAEAEEAARARGIELIPGIELAVSYPSGRFHMLGYLIDYRNETLCTRLQRLKDNRARRNARMAERMQELGLPVSLAEIEAEAGGGQVGRPHMALLLVRKGVVATTQEAFDRYLADGAIAHLPKDKIELEEGIDLIHAAGGLAVMAHPSSLRLTDEEMERELPRLRALGLDGIECYYSTHTPERNESLVAMAGRAGLLATGGSDFHGVPKPDIRLGHVERGLPAPDALLHAMKDYRAARANAG